MKPRILAVDDDPMNREIIREILEDDYALDLAESGEDAIRRARERKPDLVVLDIMMPGIDGYETCRRLKVMYPYLKIILVSAKAMPRERLEGYEVGADDYITKPFEPAEFSAKVAVFLRLGSVEEIGQIKSDLITMISHEARTPLAHILSSTQLLEYELGPSCSAEHKELFGIVLNGVSRIQSILEKSMTLFRHNSEGETERVPISLRRVLEGEISRNRLDHPQVRIEFTGEDVEVPGEPSLLAESFRILIRELVERSASGGLVNVEVKSSEDAAVVRLRDFGSVPTEEEIRHFFELFSEADVGHHTGLMDLDLPICASILRRHGGEVHVLTERDGLSWEVILPTEMEEHRRVA